MQEKGKKYYIVFWSLMAVMEGILFFWNLGDATEPVVFTVLHALTAVVAAVNAIMAVVKNRKEKTNEVAEA